VITPSGASRKKARRKTKAVTEDWQYFDPDETRFASLLAKLDEITTKADKSVNR
jgi:hypothetical protein